VNTKNYSVVVSADQEVGIDYINAVQVLQNAAQYILPTSPLVAIRVVDFDTIDVEYDDGNTYKKLVYRTLLIAYDTAIYELEWEFDTDGGTNPKPRSITIVLYVKIHTYIHIYSILLLFNFVKI
jgi:hypothetical protein